MKKNILVSAAGTATAWHIVNVIKKHFKDKLNIYVCDTNPKHLVATSTLADKFFQVPSFFDENYYSHMLNLLIEQSIDIYIPLIDYDFINFSQDNPDLIKNGIISLAPVSEVAELITNKRVMYEFFTFIGVNVPKIFSNNEIEDEIEYFVKPVRGYGSKGTRILKGREIQKHDDIICQSICLKPELTVEVYSDTNNLISLGRERIEVKAGVATKAKCFYDDEVHSIITKIAQNVSLPLASCIQFMKDSNNEWSLIDLNLRIGAGTALSSAIGFEIVRAVFEKILNGEDVKQFLKIPSNPRYIVRAYQEIVTV